MLPPNLARALAKGTVMSCCVCHLLTSLLQKNLGIRDKLTPAYPITNLARLSSAASPYPDKEIQLSYIMIAEKIKLTVSMCWESRKLNVVTAN